MRNLFFGVFQIFIFLDIDFINVVELKSSITAEISGKSQIETMLVIENVRYLWINC